MQQAVIRLVRVGVILLVAVAVISAVLITYARLNNLILLSVRTGSMQPAIYRGDAVLIRERPTRLSPGDIVTFRSAENPHVTITHRLITYDAVTGGLVTKGDALQVSDQPISPDRLVGKVEQRMPLIGYSLDAIRHPIGLIATVHLPATLLTAGEVKRLVRHYKQQRYRLYAYPW